MSRVGSNPIDIKEVEVTIHDLLMTIKGKLGIQEVKLFENFTYNISNDFITISRSDNERKTKEKYFKDLEDIINLSNEKNIIPVLVSPINGWKKNIDFSTEEFMTMQQELNDYWPLTPKEIEEFYIDYAKSYRKLANKKEMMMIDIENDFGKNKKLFLNAEKKLSDLHHLSPEGNMLLAKLIFDDIKGLLEEIK